MSAPQRRKTISVDVGGVKVGGPRPIIVQSMTNTDTADVPATVRQVAALSRAGSELVRLTVNNEDAAAAVWRRFVARRGPSPREVVLLRGLARQIAWAGRVARSGTGTG